MEESGIETTPPGTPPPHSAGLAAVPSTEAHLGLCCAEHLGWRVGDTVSESVRRIRVLVLLCLVRVGRNCPFTVKQ